MHIRACETPGTLLCADPLRSAPPEEENHRVDSGPGLPGTQSHTLPRRGGGPAPCGHGYRALPPGRRLR